MSFKAPLFNFLKSGLGTDSSIISAEFKKVEDEFEAGLKMLKGSLAAGNANAFAFSHQNPESSKIFVSRVLIIIETAGGTASSVLDVGPAASATGTSDTLIDGLDLNTTGIFDNITDKGTNGKSRQIVDENGGTNDYITGKILGANAATLVGKYYIFYTVV